jgi:hypothetical protein
MAERFSIKQVNHYLWRRQGFDGAARPALDSVLGVYATSPTCYLTLVARDPAFRFADLDDWLYTQRQAVRIRAMRYSNFIIPVRLLPAVFQAVRSDLANPLKQMFKMGVSEAQYHELALYIEQILGDQTMTAGEIKAALPPEMAALGPALAYAAPQMCAEGRLVRAKVRGGWKSDLYEYARFDRWLPGVKLDSVTPEEGRVALAREYFGSYGPATVEDFRWWSGLNKTDVKRAVESLSSELVPVEIDGAEYRMPADRLDALRDCPAELPQGARLLPVWDAYLMAYKDRARFVPEQLYDYVYAKTGDATSTVLVNGTIGGVWDFEEVKKTLIVKATLFEQAGTEVWRELEQQVVRLAEATGYPSASLVRCDAPVTLKGGSQNLFKSPLKDVEGETVFGL